MEIRDEDFGADLALVEGDDDICSSPETAPTCAPRDLRSLYERERARADGAEARCEELRRAEIDSRARASSLKWQLDTCRRKLSEAAEETKEVRRTAKDALSLQAEVARLEKLLSEAGVESSKRSRISSVSKERRRLRAALEQAENQKDKSLRTGCGELRKEVTRLNKEVARLNKRQARETQASETHKNTIGRQLDENIQLRAKLRIFRDQADRVRSLSDDVFWLRIALEGSEARKVALKARLAKLRATGATLSKLPFDEAAQLCNALRRSRRQKTAVDGKRKLDISGNRKLNTLGVGAYPQAGVGLGGAVGNWLGDATADESGGDKPVIHSGRAARLPFWPATTTRPSCGADPSRPAAGSDDRASCNCSRGC